MKISGPRATKAIGAALATLGVSGWLLLGAPLVGTWEGLYTHTYKDIVGVPTYCLGETEDAKMGRTYTEEQCVMLLLAKLPRYNNEINRCIKVAIPDKVRAAAVSLAYNVGSGAFCKSTAVKRMNAGDLAGACDAMRRFNRAGGRVVQGLVNRRNDEYKLCMEGVRA